MPKRKAAPKLSVAIDHEDDDTGVDSPVEDLDTAPPPAKRARGQARSATAAAPKKTTARKPRSTVVVGPKRRGARAGSTAKQHTESITELSEVEDAGQRHKKEQPNGYEASDLSVDELDSPETLTTAAKRGRTAATAGTRRGRKPASERNIVNDGGFEYTPSTVKTKIPPKKPTRSKPAPVAEPRPSTSKVEAPVYNYMNVDHTMEDDDTGIPEDIDWETSLDLPSPVKALIRELEAAESPQADNASETILRQQLSNVKKKLKVVEEQYRALREVGIVEANANFEKLKKDCENMTKASNNLITALKRELAKQSDLANEFIIVQRRLNERDSEVLELNSQVKSMGSDLTKSQNEIKALQARLTAARNTSASTEQSRVPGSTGKNAPSSRSTIAANAESAQALQVAQLKEDLYSDLTGLIIRGVKKRDVDNLYDCIQTGSNGTLHFKLAVADDTENKVTTDLEAAEFQYMPLLDQNRDRSLIEVLPDYLSVDITFSRQHASKFYNRVVDTLTRKRIDDN
ncbi:hypothetical protein LOZ58_002998 [Ophidiomyces ophidiicola]|nr:hypothetical protein LOZ58_002998 [Ophidiomyces ophidiicola]